MMLNRIKRGTRVFAVAMIVMMILGCFAGCGSTVSDPVIGHIGDLKIKYSTYIDYYNNYYSFYNQYGLYDVSTEERHEQFANTVWDAIVDNYLPVYYANKAGVTLTDEEEAKVKSDLQSKIDTYITSYESKVDSSITDETAKKDAAMKLLEADLKTNNTTYNEYFGKIEQQLRDAAIGDKYVNSLMTDINVSEQDIEEYYNNKVEEERSTYANDPEQYYKDFSYYVTYSDLKPLVAPEGYCGYKQIFVKDEDGKDVDSIVAKVEAELKAGTDFDTLIAKYGEDSGMLTEPTKTMGYVVSKYNTDDYYAEFLNAALALENVGDISDPVKTDVGTHIIQKACVISTDPVPLEEVHDVIATSVDTEKRNARLDEYLEQWKGETEIKFNYDSVKYVGRS